MCKELHYDTIRYDLSSKPTAPHLPYVPLYGHAKSMHFDNTKRRNALEKISFAMNRITE